MKAFILGMAFGLWAGLNWDMITDDYVDVYTSKAKDYINERINK